MSASYAVCVLFPAVLLADLATVVYGTLLVLSTWWRARQLAGRARDLAQTALVGAGLLGAALVAGGCARLWWGADATDAALIGYDVAVAAAALVLATGLRLPRPEVVADLAIDLGQPRTDTLRDDLARALHDPDLQIGYWSAATGTYRRADGSRFAAAGSDVGRTTIEIERGGARPVALRVDALLAQDTRIRSAIEVAVRAGAVNDQRSSDVLARLRALEDSRRRLVVATDLERARLEEELERGIVDGLAEVADRLRTIAGSGAEPPRVRRAADLLDLVVDELEAMASGLRPRELDSGLTEALRRMAETSPVHPTFSGTARPAPEAVELTLWYVCGEALTNVSRHAPGARATVRLESLPHGMRVEIHDDGPGGAQVGPRGGLIGLRDRVESLGGRLTVRSGVSGTLVRAELPCP
ncbi:MAG TPA: hypothetical protein VNR17_15965 [Luteimicrobium sp.]|nr:hypothetical protein [Luteimicrobium sp.]